MDTRVLRTDFALRKQPKRYPLRQHITAFFAALFIIAMVTIGTYSIIQFRQLSGSAVRGIYQSTLQSATQRVDQIAAPARAVVDLMASQKIAVATDLPTRLQGVGFLREALLQSPNIAAVYVGYQSGEIFLMRRLDNDAARKAFNAPAATAFLVESVTYAGDRPVNERIYLSASMQEIGRATGPEVDDLRRLIWYQRAITGETQVQSDPALLPDSGIVGMTIARSTPDKMAVVAADILLSSVSETLDELTPTASARLVLLTNDHRIIASNNPTDLTPDGAGSNGRDLMPVTAKREPAFAAFLGDRPLNQILSLSIVSADDRDWLVNIQPVSGIGSRATYLGMAIPTDEVLSESGRIQKTLIIVSSILLLLAIFAVWALARQLTKPLKTLADEAQSIRDFDFSNTVSVNTGIAEVDELSIIMNEMKTTIRRFLEIGSALTAERDFSSLLNRILREMVDVARAAGGAIYLLEADGAALRLETARTSDGRSFDTIDESYAARIVLEIRNSIVSDAALRRKIEFKRIRNDELKSVDRAIAAKLEVTSSDVDLVAVPLLNPRGEALGVVLLVSEPDFKSAADPATTHLLALVKAIAGSAAIAIENKQLLIAQKNLMDSLIKLVAGAIDAKSPHTGGHCQRVPALAKMLAEAASKQTFGPFANFRLSEEEWEALELASWLHDCGKVTTPEYVVDKATKLETLYNRVHEIRTRFEVVKREEEIRLLRGRLAGTDLSDVESRLREFNAKADSDFAFVADCNVGSESMAPEKLDRLREIAARTWTRTLDDRLGISHEEMSRRRHRDTESLPAIEHVLDDKPEHVIHRVERDTVDEGNAWGFKLNVPEHKYNYGEIHNLSILRGTLTDEERYVINDHIVQTIVMLESLPFPRHLRHVPEIAGGHHERMDGNGYPRKLKGHEMSVLARIMAIADVFEALTAGDRPYKKAKPLSEAIRIMGSFKRNGHLDPDLLDLFLETNVWMDYSYRFLNADQMDEPDIRAVLAIRPAAA